ncbi:MAG: metal ABC transporter substrate-binding protein, partial [Bacillota bacterium]
EEHDHDHEEEHDHDHDEEEHDHDHEEEEHDHDHEEEEHDHDHEEEEHDHDHDEEGHTHSHEDEHIWLSLKNAITICEAIANELTAINSEGNYIENANKYIEALASLDAEYETMVDASETNTLLFADRFPFRYLVDDYGIDYYAAFSGCSAETEASFETIMFLSQKLDELDLEEIIIIDGSDAKIAETVNSNSANDQETIVMDSMQSITASDVTSGASYLDIMKQNLEVLGIALD